PGAAAFGFGGVRLVRPARHDGHAATAITLDGTAHRGKAACVRRLFGTMSDLEFDKLLCVAKSSWKKDKFENMFFYLMLANLQHRATVWKREGRRVGKFCTMSKYGFLGFVVRVLSSDVYLRLYKLRALVS